MVSGTAIIAVIDDDGPLRDAMDNLVRSFGFDVATFPSAESFLDHVPAVPFDLIISDVQMPGIGGDGLQKALRDQAGQTPIIFMTAHQDSDMLSQLEAGGAVACLLKPFDGNVLLDLIERILTR